MNRIVVFGVGAALALQGGSAPAQTAASAGTRYDCDTPANRFSDLTIPAGRAPFVVTGRVRFASGQSGQVLPMTRIAISSAAGAGATSEGWAGFEYTMAPASADSQARAGQLAFSLRQAGGDNARQTIGAAGGAEVTFSLMYDGTAVLAIVDGNARRLPFAVTSPAINIVCSTGEFVYSDLRISPVD